MKQKVLLVTVLAIMILIWYLRRTSQYTEEEPKVIWFTMINKGYVDYTKNFLKSMKKSGCKFKLIVYCLDTQAMDDLKDYDNCECIKFDMKKSMSTNMSKWATKEYKQIVFAKVDAMQKTLQKYPDKPVGYIDTDIVLVSDPTPIILDSMQKHPDVDIFAQCDESAPQCKNHSDCPSICSGVIVFRKPLPDHIFKYTNEDINKFQGDQDFLLDKFNTNGIKTLTIDKNVFLNGSYEGIQSGSPVTLPKKACLVHFNWMVGDQKVKRMKEQEMWYLE
jgi:hypothetical protein